MGHLPRSLMVLLLLVAGLAWRDWSQRPLVQPQGLRLDFIPRQQAVQNSEVIALDEFRLQPRARFEVQARVLSRERYFWGPSADLAPVDLALGWGAMSDQSVVDRIEVSQGARWYTLRWGNNPPLQERDIMRQSGNMHIIPADKWVKEQALGLREGEFVQLNGYLVDVQGPGGFRWSSSLSRDDTGDGSCELFLVETINRLNPE